MNTGNKIGSLISDAVQALHITVKAMWEKKISADMWNIFR